MNKEKLLQYKMDYSVYILRVEKKRLGRLISNDKLTPDEIEIARNQIKQIADALDLLKKKYKIQME